MKLDNHLNRRKFFILYDDNWMLQYAVFIFRDRMFGFPMVAAFTGYDIPFRREYSRAMATGDMPMKYDTIMS